MKERPLVDDKAFELAEHFMSDEYGSSEGWTDDAKWSLAEAIQTAVENWFEMRDHEVVVAAEGTE